MCSSIFTPYVLEAYRVTTSSACNSTALIDKILFYTYEIDNLVVFSIIKCQIQNSFNFEKLFEIKRVKNQDRKLQSENFPNELSFLDWELMYYQSNGMIIWSIPNSFLLHVNCPFKLYFNSNCILVHSNCILLFKLHLR